MQRPCRSPVMPCRVNSHIPCRAPAILRQCRVVREIPRGSRKYPNCCSYSLTDWYASDNLRGTPRVSRKKPNAGRSPTCRPWTADTNSHMQCHAHAALCRGLEKSLSERRGRRMARARHGMCESKTAALCKSNGNDTVSALAARHGRGTAWYV
jgi:hypothetical protein